LSKGMHIILDCYDVSRDLCLDDKRLLETVTNAAKLNNATIINTSRYHFGHNSPPGCTVFVMLDESHISVHTYADRGKMAIDVFTCGNTDAPAIAEQLKTLFGLDNYTEKSIGRF
jgi:S-adenosylmethionine decarboxylase